MILSRWSFCSLRVTISLSTPHFASLLKRTQLSTGRFKVQTTQVSWQPSSHRPHQRSSFATHEFLTTSIQFWPRRCLVNRLNRFSTRNRICYYIPRSFTFGTTCSKPAGHSINATFNSYSMTMKTITKIFVHIYTIPAHLIYRRYEYFLLDKFSPSNKETQNVPTRYIITAVLDSCRSPRCLLNSHFQTLLS